MFIRTILSKGVVYRINLGERNA